MLECSETSEISGRGDTGGGTLVHLTRISSPLPLHTVGAECVLAECEQEEESRSLEEESRSSVEGKWINSVQ